MVSEYGTTTYRPHYHVLLFFKEIMPTETIQKAIENSWTRGHYYLGEVSQASIHYTCKYHITKNIYPDGLNRPFTLMSRRPAIGFDYIQKNLSYHKGNTKKSFVTYQGGQKQVIPRYFKNKIYTEDERKEIAAICKPKEFVNEEKYFKTYPKHTHSQYRKYVEDWKNRELNKIHKQRNTDKL